MITLLRSTLGLCLLAAAAWNCVAAEPGTGRALLVGCTTYDHLEAAYHLQGPGNDVVLIKSLLCGRFGFPESQVTVLAEASGRPDLRPTRANIEREFHRLQQQARRGEQVVVFLAGHGSQQPDQNPTPDDPEPDGLDELFLPADIAGWDGSTGQVRNALVDDELRNWLTKIEQTGALVTVVLDACHAGTMTRGFDEQVRGLPPRLLIPHETLNAAIPSGTRGSAAAPAESAELAGSSIVAIYAAQSTEATVEKLLPMSGSDRRPHGLLTFTLAQILTQADHPVTYRELVRQIQTQYVGMGRTAPTPMIEGQGRNREVFGKVVWPDSSPIRLTQAGDRWRINAGAIHGLTPGSILAVRAAESRDADPIGYVRVQVARTADADVVPSEFQGRRGPPTFPQSAHCELIARDSGDLTLSYAVIGAGDVDSARVQELTRRLTETAEPASTRLSRLVPEQRNARWLVQIHPRGIDLVPADRAVTESADPDRIAFRLDGAGDEALWIRDTLERIARAENLKRLAADADSGSGGQTVRVDLSLHRSESASRDETLPVLYDGERLTIRVVNPCRFPVDVTLLAIDAASGIEAVFPNRGEINRLQPGDAIELPVQVVAVVRGREHLVAIVTRGEGEVLDFSVLAQPGLGSARTRGLSHMLKDPFGEMLAAALLAEGGVRGIRQPVVRTHRLQLRTWEVRPKPGK